MKEITINQSNWLYRYATWLRNKTDCYDPIETICDLTSTVIFRTLLSLLVCFFTCAFLFTLFLGLFAPVWAWFIPGAWPAAIAGLAMWIFILHILIKEHSNEDNILFEMYRNFKDKTCVKLNIVKG